MRASQTRISRSPAAIALALTMAAAWGAKAFTGADSAAEQVKIQARGFVLATNDSVSAEGHKWVLTLESPQSPPPFVQSAVKQDEAPARFGPDPRQPYFTVRFALPIPPENGTNNCAGGFYPQPLAGAGNSTERRLSGGLVQHAAGEKRK